MELEKEWKPIINPINLMLQLTLKEAENQLPELLKAVAEGQHVIIQNNEGQDFQIISLPTHSQKNQYGSAKGIVKMLDNFDDPIEDFNYQKQVIF